MKTNREIFGSNTVKKQVQTIDHVFQEDGKYKLLKVEIRWDDSCGNGRNSFAITGEIWASSKEGKAYGRDCECCGCIHDEIIKHLPHLEKYIRWHGMFADAPMHYVANTMYHVSDKDCWGRRKGEGYAFEPHLLVSSTVGETTATSSHRISKELADALAPLTKHPGNYYDVRDDAENDKDRVLHYESTKDFVVLTSLPTLFSEGKERDLNAARSCAVWPDATDEELLADDLEEKLLARIPSLITDFKHDVEELGLQW